MKYNWRRFAFLLFAVVVLLVFSIDANAQCSMCRAALTGANNAKFLRNLNIGVLVLLLPPVSIFCSIFIVLKRHRGDNTQDELDNS